MELLALVSVTQKPSFMYYPFWVNPSLFLIMQSLVCWHHHFCLVSCLPIVADTFAGTQCLCLMNLKRFVFNYLPVFPWEFHVDVSHVTLVHLLLDDLSLLIRLSSWYWLPCSYVVTMILCKQACNMIFHGTYYRVWSIVWQWIDFGCLGNNWCFMQSCSFVLGSKDLFMHSLRFVKGSKYL